MNEQSAAEGRFARKRASPSALHHLKQSSHKGQSRMVAAVQSASEPHAGGTGPGQGEKAILPATFGGTCCNEWRSWKRIALANAQGPVRVSALLKHPVKADDGGSRPRILRDGSLHQAQADVQLHELVTGASRLARELSDQSLVD